jgi:quercetin dioxygenase-like cupin family protein
MKDHERLSLGRHGEDFYADALRRSAEADNRRANVLQSVISAEDQMWERSAQGLIKHLVNERLDAAEPVLDMYQQVIPAGGHSGRHRHFSEELIFVVEGSGYDLHWDPIFEPDVRYEWDWQQEAGRFEWRAGDYVWIPPYTVHQHFADPGSRVRFLSATIRIVKELGYDGLEQLTEASDVDESVLTGEGSPS